jgi:threonyl-tRNA synthetase
MDQVKEECDKIWQIVHSFYPTFGFELKVRLSLHDPENPEKYLGDKDRWSKAENMLREILEEKKVPSILGIGEAAFYGPKLDFMAEDAIGRTWQVATIQLDMNMPERFDLYCINEKGEKERIVMIHAAIMGSIERFLSVLIEHTAGNFPLWLAPVQVEVIPVMEKHNEEALKIHKILLEKGIRSKLSNGDIGFGKKIREAKEQKVPYFVILGDKDIAENKVTLESRDKGNLGQISVEELVVKLDKENRDRR